MITAWLVIAVTVTLCYAAFIFICIWGFTRMQPPDANEFPAHLPAGQEVTVIVAFRNEKHHLLNLISSLQQQDYPFFRVVLVDDHSTDGFQVSLPQGFICIKNNGAGKKQALITGCELTQTPLVAFTDADCRHSPAWLSTLVQPLTQAQNGLAIGGVVPSNSRSFFAWDDLAISAASIGAASSGFPWACSGASMACRRSDFMAWQPYSQNNNQLSGDDVFLLQACIKNKKKVAAVLSSHAAVLHPSAPTLKVFLQQRMRWGQKTGIHSMPAFIAAVIVWVYSMFLYACPVLCAVNLKAAAICAWALIIGAIVNFLLLFLVSHHWRCKPSAAWLLPAYLFHLAYIPWAALLGKILPLDWKGRRIKSRN